MSWKYLVILLLSIKLIVCARLETSNDDVVIDAIRENKNLIILFCKFKNLPESLPKMILRKIFQPRKIASNVNLNRTWQH